MQKLVVRNDEKKEHLILSYQYKLSSSDSSTSFRNFTGSFAVSILVIAVKICPLFQWVWSILDLFLIQHNLLDFNDDSRGGFNPCPFLAAFFELYWKGQHFQLAII